MKTIIKYLVFRIYKMALAEQESIPVLPNFLIILSIFEVISAGCFALYFKYFIRTFEFSLTPFTSVIAFVLIMLLNYLIFVKTNYHEKIYNEYSNSSPFSKLLGNIIFIGYIVLVFILLAFSVYFHQNK
jgi:hypothetical protein